MHQCETCPLSHASFNPTPSTMPFPRDVILLQGSFIVLVFILTVSFLSYLSVYCVGSCRDSLSFRRSRLGHNPHTAVGQGCPSNWYFPLSPVGTPLRAQRSKLQQSSYRITNTIQKYIMITFSLIIIISLCFSPFFFCFHHTRKERVSTSVGVPHPLIAPRTRTLRHWSVIQRCGSFLCKRISCHCAAWFVKVSFLLYLQAVQLNLGKCVGVCHFVRFTVACLQLQWLI